MIKYLYKDFNLKIYDKDILKAELNYVINDEIIIKNIVEYDDNNLIEFKSKYLSKLIDKLISLTYYLEKSYVYKGDIDLTIQHFIKDDNLYFLDYNRIRIKRFVKVGNYRTGKLNNICDVDGVKVSHFTVKDGSEYNTGLTVISPHNGNIFREKVVGASYVYNGFGKSIGFVQVDELGTIETNIVLTTTLNVGKIADAVVSYSLEQNPEITISTGTVNPLILECNDGTLNNSRNRILGRLSYIKALKELNTDFKQGAIGAGAGMICHGFKGGIGSSSRIITVDGKDYTIGVMVNSNFGESNGKSLIFNGRHLENNIKEFLEKDEEKGSIAVVIATDLPLNERQLKRVIKRAEIGIGRTGSYAGNGSGDVFTGFSTVNKVNHFTDNAITTIERFSDNKISTVFKATVDAVEEAVLNSMLFSPHVKGFLKEVRSLNEVNELFYDLLSEEIDYEI